MTQKLIIKGRLPSLNEYINACRRNRYAAAKMKEDSEDKIGWCIMGQKLEPVKGLVDITYVFYESNRKRDKDNISGVAHKFINDALVKFEILENDGWKNIGSLTDIFETDRENPRIEVYIDDIRT